MARHHEHGERDRDESDERQQPRDPHHHDDRADQRQHLRKHLRQRLLQALRDVIDVVRHPAQQVAPLRLVHVAERQAVQLLLDLPPQPVHRSLDDAGEQVRHAVLQDP